MNIEDCHGCTRYQLDCNGHEHYLLEAMKNKKLIAICNNQDRGLGNTASPVQVQAFMSLHRVKMRGEKANSLTAFVESIVQTSDDAFENVDTELLAEYLERNAK